MSGLKDVRNWVTTSEAGNRVRHCRYDNVTTGKSSYVTVTYMPDGSMIPAYRQGPIGEAKLPDVTESQFDDAGFAEAWATKQPSKFASLFAQSAPAPVTQL